MINFASYFAQGLRSTLKLLNGTNFSYKGSWVQVYPDTEIDRWYVGDYSSVNYTITAEFSSNKKEVLQVLVVGRPNQATVTVYGRTSIDDSLINISAIVNNSYVSIIANVTDTTFLGTKLIFFANYAECIYPLSIAEDISFIDSSLGSGYDGGGGSIGAATSFSQLSGTIGLSQISNGLITPTKLNLNAALIPTSNEAYDLGSTAYRWRDLYLSGNSLQLGNATITASGSSIVLPIGTTVAGSSINSFATVSISGQSSLVADSAGDTLTLVAGPGIQLTTNAGTDTITITNTGGGGGGSGVSTGTTNRLAYYASTGSVVQDTGANLTWNNTNLNITGTVTATGDVSYVRAYFDTLVELQAVSAVTWHGMVAHVHESGGRMYYAHGGAWQPMANFSDLNIFKTIAVSGQSNIEADTATDTLTLVAGTNVTITTDATTDTITINAAGSGSSALDDLTDVAISVPSLGQVLKYNGTSWINDADATGGGGSNTFSSIAVAGQSTVQADSLTDTLTLVAGTNVTITTNATTDTITINSTASAGVTTFAALTDNAGLTVDQFYLPAITRLAVQANGTSSYSFDQYSGTNPTIYAISGTTIAFDLSVGQSTHPFLIRFSGSNYNTGLVHVTTAGVVTTGAAAQGKTSGTLYWKIPANINGNYQYICQNHGSMAGIINIRDITTI